MITRDVPELGIDVRLGEGIPGVDAAVDQRYRLTTGSEFAMSTGLLVVANADDAVAFLDGLRTAAQRWSASGVPGLVSHIRPIFGEYYGDPEPGRSPRSTPAAPPDAHEEAEHRAAQLDR